MTMKSKLSHFKDLYRHLEGRNHEKIVALSEDTSRINKENAFPIPFIAQNAPKILQHFTENGARSVQVNVI